MGEAGKMSTESSTGEGSSGEEAMRLGSVCLCLFSKISPGEHISVRSGYFRMSCKHRSRRLAAQILALRAYMSGFIKAIIATNMETKKCILFSESNDIVLL